MSVALIAVVAVVGAFTLTHPMGASGSAGSKVQIVSAGLGWPGSPAPACAESSLIFAIQPQLPFTVVTGMPFNLSYNLICAANATASPAAYVIYGVTNAAPGVTIFASNVPVGVGTAVHSWLNVTVAVSDASAANSMTFEIFTETYPVSYG